ncbi:MAG: hypothetical protein ACFE8A_06265 [Candidatus Hodarchaeota archaeon]
MLTNRKKKKRFAKRLILFLVIVNLLIPFIIVGKDNDSNYNYSYNSYDSTFPEPKTQVFSKDLYTPILEEEKHGLGSINVTEVDLQYIGEGFNLTKNADINYRNDLTSKALNMSYKGTKFIKTEKIAQVDNLNENITDFEKIVVKLNETLSIQYNESTEGFLIYASKLTPCKLIQLSVENNTRNIEDIHESNYSINEIDGIDFINFNFKNYFKLNNLNFTMHMIWQYNFTIENWQMSQYFKPELIITEEDNIIYPKFNYYFQIKGLKYIKTNESIIYQEILADDLLINLTINLPDKNLLSSHYLILNQEVIPKNDFLAPDKSVFTNFIGANISTIDLDFTTYFSIEFVEPVDYTWGIDRLVEDQDIRERIYFPKITSGPSNIYLKYIKILEETISFDQIISSNSLFKRILSYTEINVSEFEEELINSLIFHQFATKRQGIKITMPYMIKGEICPFTIKYETTNDLRIIITDNIDMPLSNFEVVIYYYGEKYGTYISKEKTQPLGLIITDENGEVLIENVPNGNYTIKIYPRDSDDLIKKAEVSSFLDINYVVTPVIHFPLLILILGGISGILLGIGLYIYRKREK